MKPQKGYLNIFLNIREIIFHQLICVNLYNSNILNTSEHNIYNLHDKLTGG